MQCFHKLSKVEKLGHLHYTVEGDEVSGGGTV